MHILKKANNGIVGVGKKPPRHMPGLSESDFFIDINSK
jgi:hypothetical protein